MKRKLHFGLAWHLVLEIGVLCILVTKIQFADTQGLENKPTGVAGLLTTKVYRKLYRRN